MSKKISQLPAAGAVAGSDQLETNQGGVSKRWTVAQLIAYLGTLNPFALTSIQSTAGGATWSINADGTSFFGAQMQLGASLRLTSGAIDINSGATQINNDGSVVFASGNASFDNLGNLAALSGNFAFGNLQLNADSSAIFASGGISLNADGSANFAGNQILLNTDGSAGFASGAITLNADGSARFVGGATTVDASGTVDAPAYSVGGTPGVTQDVSVLTALPSTFTVLHFVGGIFVGTTP